MSDDNNRIYVEHLEHDGDLILDVYNAGPTHIDIVDLRGDQLHIYLHHDDVRPDTVHHHHGAANPALDLLVHDHDHDGPHNHFLDGQHNLEPSVYYESNDHDKDHPALAIFDPDNDHAGVGHNRPDTSDVDWADGIDNVTGGDPYNHLP